MNLLGLLGLLLKTDESNSGASAVDFGGSSLFNAQTFLTHTKSGKNQWKRCSNIS